MRPSMLPRTADGEQSANADSGAHGSRLFEIGRRYFRSGNGLLSDAKPTLGIVLAGEKTQRSEQAGQDQGCSTRTMPRRLRFTCLNGRCADAETCGDAERTGPQFHPGQISDARFGPQNGGARFWHGTAQTIKADRHGRPCRSGRNCFLGCPLGEKDRRTSLAPGFAPLALQAITRDPRLPRGGRGQRAARGVRGPARGAG